GHRSRFRWIPARPESEHPGGWNSSHRLNSSASTSTDSRSSREFANPASLRRPPTFANRPSRSRDSNRLSTPARPSATTRFTGHSVCKAGLAPGPIHRGNLMSGNNDDGFVPIVGVVLLRTSLGVFLDVKGTGAFVPLTFVSTPSPALEPGSPATLM